MPTSDDARKPNSTDAKATPTPDSRPGVGLAAGANGTASARLGAARRSGVIAIAVSVAFVAAIFVLEVVFNDLGSALGTVAGIGAVVVLVFVVRWVSRRKSEPSDLWDRLFASKLDERDGYIIRTAYTFTACATLLALALGRLAVSLGVNAEVVLDVVFWSALAALLVSLGIVSRRT